MPERCQPGETPFTYVELDLFGPFYVRLGRSTVKRYGCVFTCFTTRAIHLEKLDSLETGTFINGFVCFLARRGYPAKLWSDNGTNLVGAQTELAKALRQLDREKVVAMARRHNVEWTFNPPLASHHGGVWERMIRTIRKVLLAVLNTATRLSDDVLHTVLCEVEGVVNSRPITKCSDDIDDEGALTPNHFSQFWKRWTCEYLPELQRRHKWQNVKPNIQVGDLVLVMDESMPLGCWPLGLVTETNVGRDDLIRSVKVKTKSTIMTRPITKIVLLEGVK